MAQDPATAVFTAIRLAQIHNEIEAGLDEYLKTKGLARQALTIRMLLLREEQDDLTARRDK
jgi:hypothetical protein